VGQNQPLKKVEPKLKKKEKNKNIIKKRKNKNPIKKIYKRKRLW